MPVGAPQGRLRCRHRRRVGQELRFPGTDAARGHLSEAGRTGLFYADTGEEPVLLLDDVLSELDPGRQDFVLNQIRTGQVFITCCETEKWTAIGRTLVIQDGTIRE